MKSLSDALPFKTKKNANSNQLSAEFVTLVILDGFGIREERLGNAVLHADTTFLDALWTNGISTLLDASGPAVGLPDGTVGNSEVGHLNIGVGKVIPQSLPRINKLMNSDEVFHHPLIVNLMEGIKRSGKNLHFVGILSDGGIHGDIAHLFKLLEVCKYYGVDPYIHGFLDGRDTPPHSGVEYVQQLLKKMEKIGVGHLASLSGRMFGMDRDNRWERTEVAVNAIAGVAGIKTADPLRVIRRKYEEGLQDQYMPAIVVTRDDKPVGAISTGDTLFFYNYREDRTRQLVQAIVGKDFDSFDVPENIRGAQLITMVEDNYSHKFFIKKIDTQYSLAKFLADKGKTQFHIAETEKYTHITYYLDGLNRESYKGEDRFHVPSPHVNNYAQTPEMSLKIVADELVNRLMTRDKFPHSFYAVNFANPDMLGHTGDIKATVRALEYVDYHLERVVKHSIEEGGIVVVVADHGNCETMIDPVTHEMKTSHTLNPVPFIVVSDMSQLRTPKKNDLLKIGTGKDTTISGTLQDIAPTIVHLLGYDEKPKEMTGINLLDVIDQ